MEANMGHFDASKLFGRVLRLSSGATEQSTEANRNEEKRQMKEKRVYKLQKLKRFAWQKFFPAGISLVLLAAAYNLFLSAWDLNVGGFAGISQSLAEFGLSYTLTLLALNAVPFCIAAKNRKWPFFFASLVMTILFGASLDLVPVHQLNIPGEISLILGSALAGVGFGLVCRIEASTGGSDMLSLLIIKLTKTRLSVGIIMTLIDFSVILIWIAITRTSIWTSTIAMLICNIALEVAIYWGRWDEHKLISAIRPRINALWLHLAGFRVVAEAAQGTYTLSITKSAQGVAINNITLQST